MPLRCFYFRCAIVVLALVGVASRSHAEETNFWQLTFAYDHAGLKLERAARIPSVRKHVTTPGLNSARLILPYELEWLDADGRVLLGTRVSVPLHGRHSAIWGDAGNEGEGLAAEGAFVLRIPGPENATATHVRLHHGPSAKSLDTPSLPLPPAFAASPTEFALPSMARIQAAEAQGPRGITKVRDHGPDENRFVLVIEGDGFTAGDLAAGTFSNRVSSFLQTLFSTRPWDLYANAVNVYRLDIESAESGADYMDGAPGAGGTTKDTYLNTSFWIGGVLQCFYVTGNGESRAIAAADDLVGVGMWDQILVFGNSTQYGGCGSTLGVSSMAPQADEIQTHELGHSFAGLADEYDYGSSSTDCQHIQAPNVDCADNFPSVKWDAWLTPGVPIPTVIDPWQYMDDVGVFEGAAYQATGMFRPMWDCRMRSLGEPFCPVCVEAHIMELFRRVQMLDAASPAFGAVTIPANATQTFRVAPLPVGAQSFRWFLGGAVILHATNNSLTLSASDVVASNSELRLEVTHVSTNVRSHPIVQSNFVWTLALGSQPAVQIERDPATAGNFAVAVPAGFILQHAPAVTGPWQDLSSSGPSRYAIAPAAPARFYRLRRLSSVGSAP